MTTALQLLASDRRNVLAQLDALAADIDGVVRASESSNADDEHDPEGATIAYERAQLLALRDLAQRRLADLDAAVERLRAGDYGRCERCGEQIPAARLEARPAARTCVACAPTRAPRGGPGGREPARRLRTS